jgi:hypothetical protein
MGLSSATCYTSWIERGENTGFIWLWAASLLRDCGAQRREETLESECLLKESK